MQRPCPSCGTEVETDEGRWCPNPDCGAYISWDEQEEEAVEATTTRRPGERDEPQRPPQDPTTVIPTVQPTVSCPSCGAENPEERSLCQRCGEPLRAPPPPAPQPSAPQQQGSRMGPAVLVGGGVVLVLLAVLAFVLFGGDGEQDPAPVAGVTSSPTAPTSPPAVTETEEPPSPSPSPAPAGLETPAWISILRSMPTESFSEDDARAHATSIAADIGGEPEVLLSDDHGDSLNPGYWVVYVGGFDDGDAAGAFCDDVTDTVPDCYTRLVEE